MMDQDRIDESREEALLQAETRLHALVRTAFDGIIVSENGVVIEVSKRLLDVSGYALHEIIGRPVRDFVAEEFRDAIWQRQLVAVEGRFEAVGLLKGGKRVPIEVVSTNYRTGDRLVRLTALWDVSEKRRAEERVRDAQKMEWLGRMSGAVAHDFNNVITVIRGCAELLLQRVQEAEREDVLQILAATDSATALTRQLLAFSRPTLTNPRTIELNTLVRSYEPMLRRLAGNQIELAIDLDQNTGTVQLDPTQLQQVAFNLVVNAREAMRGGGRLLIRTRRVEIGKAEALSDPPHPPGAYAMIEVADTGSGMSPEIQSKIFDPFFTTREHAGGTGLGLAVVKGIVERSGGFIVVSSALGVGSTFGVYFPTDRDAPCP
jgi:PAS domain S-box-containing protein